MNNIIQLSQIDCNYCEVIFQKELVQHDRPDYSNKIRKLWFFVLREGINLTLRKIKSKKVSRELTSRKYFVITKIVIENKEFYNLSTQFQLNPQNFIIANKFYDLNTEELTFLISNYDEHFTQFNQFLDNSNIVLNKKAFKLSIKNILKSSQPPKEKKGIVIIGLGDYSRTYIAPYLKGQNKVTCVDYNILLTNYYQRNFKFKNGGLTPDEAIISLSNIDTPLLVIASYHSDHSWIAENAYQENKNTLIFIEKPPCVTLDDLKKLIQLYNSEANIEIGFNRRYIPFNRKIKKLLSNKGPKVISISIKEICINEHHWYFWNNQGTRITGNVIHWIDLAQYWIDSSPVGINLLQSSKESETLALSVQYEDGSLLNITVSDNGNGLRGVQEIIEIRCDNETIFIDDYTTIKYINKNGAQAKWHKLRRDKGHEKMYQHLIKLYQNSRKGNYPVKDLVATTIVTYFASYMYKNGLTNMNISNELNNFYLLVN